MHARILVRGDAACISTLERWAARAGDSIPAMKAISELYEEEERKLFQSEGASSGRPWEQDTAITMDSRASRGWGDKILQASNALYNSLTDSSDPNAMREIGPGWLRFGTKLAYAAILQRGDRKMPPRRPMDINSAHIRYEVTQMMGDWIAGRVTKSIRPSIRIFRR